MSNIMECCTCDHKDLHDGTGRGFDKDHAPNSASVDHQGKAKSSRYTTSGWPRGEALDRIGRCSASESEERSLSQGVGQAVQERQALKTGAPVLVTPTRP